MTRVIVCGGRHFGKLEHQELWALGELASLHAKLNFSFIIDGGATGADACARKFRRITGLSGETYHANWFLHGKAAGPFRNRLMLVEGRPDLVIAMPGGAGTSDMVRRAESAGVEVREIAP